MELNLDTWFTRSVFFLKGRHILEDVPPFGIFALECEDNQVVHSANQTLYNLETRHWHVGPNLIYDVDKAVYHREEKHITVYFIILDTQSKKRLRKLEQKYPLDDDPEVSGVNPSCNDYQPRREVMETFTSLGLTEGDVEKFFRLFYLASLDDLYRNHPSAAEGKKPVHQGLLTRLYAAFNQLPVKYPLFAQRYSFDPGPLCLVDQRLDREDKESNRVGNLLVQMTLKHDGSVEEFRW